MPKLIAIIDDEAEMEFIYGMLLEEYIQTKQVRMEFFSDSRHFILWLQNNHPDLVLSDINMPYVTGPELGHRIRESGRTIPTYFISGHDETEYTAKMNQLGSCRYVAKPINVAHFLQHLKTDLTLKG